MLARHLVTVDNCGNVIGIVGQSDTFAPCEIKGIVKTKMAQFFLETAQCVDLIRYSVSLSTQFSASYDNTR